AGQGGPLSYDAADDEPFDLVPSIIGLGELKKNPFPYDSRIANLLMITSAWTYADGTLLSSMLDRRGLPGNRCRYVEVVNDACLVYSKGYLIQSADGRVLILSFRGTEFTSVINMLVDINFKKDRFYSLGHVHSGFNRNVGAIWPYLMLPVRDALQGKPI